MSQIYLATETRLHDREVVVKVMADHLARDPVYRSRFNREVRLMATLRHPNILNVITASTPDAPLLYVVTPRADTDLRQLVRTAGPLDPEETLHIVRQVASALDHAHEHGIVHRDVKPGNILLLGRERHVYLSDFGIAREIYGEPLTRTGAQVGTPGYLAPELYAGARGRSTESAGTLPYDAPRPLPRIDRAGDVYSLGAVLYYCLTGRPAFDAREPVAVAVAQVETDPRPVSELRPGLGEAVDRVVSRAMARDPRQRYGTCAELVEALAEALRASPGGGAAARPPRPAAGPSAPSVGTGDGTAPRPDASPAAPRPDAPPRRRGQLAAVLATAAVLVLGVVLAVTVPALTDDALSGLLTRVPEPLRQDCRVASTGSGLPGATDVLTCHDGGQAVTVSMFDDLAPLDAAYTDAVERAGIARGSGDCTVATGAEHRYPAAGKTKGRVLCYRESATTSVVWTDDTARTVGWASRRDTDGGGLEQAWARWVALPSFPTPEESALVDLVDLEGCRRPLASSLEPLRNLVAAVECLSRDVGADWITYYQFADLDSLERAYHEQANAIGAPEVPTCDAETPDFLGAALLDLRSVVIGDKLCFRNSQGRPVLVWTFTPILLMGQAVGSDVELFVDWWIGYYGHGTPTTEIVRAVNAAADPPFPTPQETALLAHVPVGSKVNCMRPPRHQVERNVAREPVAAVVCGPTPGASIVFYYQVEDLATLRAEFADNGGAPGADCTSRPEGFEGNAPYSIGERTGQLACDENDGAPYLIWTDERRNIIVFAFFGYSHEALLRWWESEAGPM